MGTQNEVSDRIGRNVKLHDDRQHEQSAVALLHTTQSAISRSIAALEHAFGVRLLDRRIKVSNQRSMAWPCSMVGRRYSTICAKGKEHRVPGNPTDGEVRVGVPDLIVIGVLSAVINGLRCIYPGISIQVTPIIPNNGRTLMHQWPAR